MGTEWNLWVGAEDFTEELCDLLTLFFSYAHFDHSRMFLLVLSAIDKHSIIIYFSTCDRCL